MTNYYLLTVHENGRFRSLSPAAQAYWQSTGAEIGSLLRSETPLPFTAILTAYAEYLYDHPENGRVAAPDANYVRQVLNTLAAHGLVQILNTPASARVRSNAHHVRR